MGVNLDVGLRRLVLTAAGWSAKVEPAHGQDWYRLVMPDGAFQHTYYWSSEEKAWEHAPAVESSIDTILFIIRLQFDCKIELFADVTGYTVSSRRFSHSVSGSVIKFSDLATYLCWAYLRMDGK